MTKTSLYEACCAITVAGLMASHSAQAQQSRRVPQGGNQGGITIPFGGNNGGGIRIGGNGLGIQLPGSSSGGEIFRPGPTLNIPFQPSQPPRPPRPPIQSSLPHPYPPSYPPSRPPYRPQSPQIVRPYPQPAPPAPMAAPPKPPTNTVVTNVKPRNNDGVNANFREISSAETDARQEVKATESINDVTADIDEQIKATGDVALLEAWNKVDKDDPAAVNQFFKDQDATLTQDMKDMGALRGDFVEYAEDLRAGRLSDKEKNDRLAELNDRVNAEGGKPGRDPALFESLADNVESMQNFQIIGQLADAVQGTANPFPPLVQGAIQIGMPPIMFVSELTGLPILPIDPVASLPGSWPDSGEILIHNLASNGESVGYLLDSHSYTMAPGHQQKLDRGYLISFDSGVGGESKKYQLSSGVYEWRLDLTSGWNLYKVKVRATIDNSRYDGEFRYVLNNEHKSVGAGGVVEHVSDTPLRLAFDRGNGTAEVRKLLKSGRYVVGVDPKAGGLDLFDGERTDQAMSDAPEYVASTRDFGAKASHEERVVTLLAQLERQSDQRSRAGASLGRTGRTPKKGVSPLGGPPQPSRSVDELLKSLGKGEGSAGN